MSLSQTTDSPVVVDNEAEVEVDDDNVRLNYVTDMSIIWTSAPSFVCNYVYIIG